MLKKFEKNDELFDKFIQGWYIEEDFCDEILDFFKNTFNKETTEFSGRPKNYFVMDLSTEFSKSLNNRYYSFLNKCLNDYTLSYSYLTDMGKQFLVKHINVQYYEKNKFYEIYHCERASYVEHICRSLVFTTYLNDVSDRGETEFFYQNVKVKPKKGLTIVWPSEWTHTHRGIESNEEKYIITGWMELKPNYDNEQRLIDLSEFNKLNINY